MAARARAFHPIDPRGATLRLLVAASLGIVTWILVPSSIAPTTRALVAWDTGAFVLLVLAFWIIVRSDAEETKRRAAAHDPGRTAVWLIVIVATAFSLFAAALVFREVKFLPPVQARIHLALCVGAIIGSWCLAHTAFTLRYAHLYYRGGDKAGGIDIPGDLPPDDLDFAYFAFTIGMCFQVSDAAVSDRLVRRTVLVHALLSFGFNTVIVAFALNLFVGQLG